MVRFGVTCNLWGCKHGFLLINDALTSAIYMQAISLLASRYLSCWDVCYHTLRTLTRLAQQRAARGEATAAAAAGAGAESDEEDEQSAAAAADGQQQLPKTAADVARTMFDVLAAVQPILPQQRQQQQQQQQEEEDPEELPSWCGASEVGYFGYIHLE
jgi:hypothetical protein